MQSHQRSSEVIRGHHRSSIYHQSIINQSSNNKWYSAALTSPGFSGGSSAGLSGRRRPKDQTNGRCSGERRSMRGTLHGAPPDGAAVACIAASCLRSSWLAWAVAFASASCLRHWRASCIAFCSTRCRAKGPTRSHEIPRDSYHNTHKWHSDGIRSSDGNHL